MKKIIIGAVIALILFITILLTLAPARVATPWITNAVPGLSLTNVSGSIWSTHIEQANFRNLTLNDIDLEPSAVALLWGKLEAKISVNDRNVSVDAEALLSRNSYSLQNARFDLDSAYIASLVKTPIEGLSGRVNGEITEFKLEQNQLKELAGEGLWRDAVILYPNNNLDVGHIRFQLSKSDTNDNAAKITIVENPGVLDLKGYIEIGLNKQFNMSIHATNDLPSNLKSWLTRWGRQSDDRIYLEWQGRLP